MSLDGLTLFTMLACASAGAAIGAVFGGARVASLRARHKHLVRLVRQALWHLESGHSKMFVSNALYGALEDNLEISAAIQEDPHSEPAGDFPDTKHIRVGD